ncbi:hypothetical protein FH972_023485 [Carpinus fangiana]|uniref:Adenylate kinase isoenzyme 6 homolog n=1 Tax=Carpinus fangiana TaxID=176857 RepID=A0A5N6KVT1_9ROSI|nr:hypothetical protein FH972_023485 [Carpinus fangiana]
MPSATGPKLPNIILSGSPGTGKSTLSAALVSALPRLRYINVSSEADVRGCRGEYDVELKTWEVDEKKLALSLRKDLEQGGVLLDWIHADFLVPELDDQAHECQEQGQDDMVDLVIQMRADTTSLYDRYKARGYDDTKIQENLDCEIMDEIGDENRDAFDEAKCVVLQGTEKDKEDNVSRVLAWVKAWQTNNESGDDED